MNNKKITKVIRKTKNMNLVQEGTDEILINLNPKDRFFCLAITSELKINYPQTVTKKVVENHTNEYMCKTNYMLECINKLINFYYNNLPKGFKRVPGIDHIFCNEHDEVIHFLRRYLPIIITPKGYGNVYIPSGIYNTSRSEFYHRIIASTWIPNPENKPQVNHIDGDKLNNKVSNLEWNTNLENARHAVKTGLRKTEAMKLNGNGEKNSQAVLTTKDVISIRQIFKTEMEKIKDYLCKTYKIALELLNDIINFNNKTLLPILYTTRTFESKMFPGKIYTVKRNRRGSTESIIRGEFNLLRRKIHKHLAEKFNISIVTIYDILSRRSWNYSYC